MKHEEHIYYLPAVNKKLHFISQCEILNTYAEVLGDKNHHVCVHNITQKLSFDIQVLKVQEFY